MSGVLRNHVRHGFYLDSVALMRLSARVAALAEVDEAVLMIGTEANLRIMSDAGLLADAGRGAGVNDLVVAVRAGTASAADAAMAQALAGLEDSTRRDGGAGGTQAARPRSLRAAVPALPGCNLALISTPGEFAVREARTALAQGLNVMIFSDNVALRHELALKREAAEKGLLVMGPDCGTAYIAGVPLAFANRVPAGSIGVIAASGTGLQEFAVLSASLGHGIRHGIGVGGRDLSDEVGGLSTLAAIDLLAADAGVDRLVLISKPPGAATADKVFSRLAACGKPVTACVFGIDAASLPPGIAHAATLKAAAEQACGQRLPSPATPLSDRAQQLAGSLEPGRHGLRGLFTGGTLCSEAQLVLREAGVTARSNAPLPAGSAPVSEDFQVLDLGADEYTVGRPHPMIEPLVRLPALEQALADDTLAVVLLDLVLGLGAHEDPAACVVAALAAAGTRRPVVVASVCGTVHDPQDRGRQVTALEQAGVQVAPSNADACALAVAVALQCARRQG